VSNHVSIGLSRTLSMNPHIIHTVCPEKSEHWYHWTKKLHWTQKYPQSCLNYRTVLDVH
jgi:hypothetical protein